MTLAVTPVATRRDRRLFRDLPALLFRGDPAFVPPLRAAVDALLDRAKNPFWRHAEAQEWLARRDGRPIGRIGACVDRDLLARAPGCGVVGFFDCGDDAEAAGALFREAEIWVGARGAVRVRGPLNYSIHDTAGVLVEGFDAPPTVDTTWNPPYYPAVYERAGYRAAKEMLGAAGMLEFEGPGRLRGFADLARKRGVVVRPIDFGRFEEEVERIRVVYNAAWDGNWGHVPIGREEFAYKAKDMKPVVDRDLLRIAEKEGTPVGLFLGLPDLNVAIARSGGRLFPLGLLRLLRARKTARRVRVVLLGVVPGFRVRGVEALLLLESFRAIGTRYPWCEASWVLADNASMVNALALYNLRPYKRWRVYEKELAPGRA